MRHGPAENASSTEWTGIEGFERFNRSSRFIAPDPRHFRAAKRTIVVDGLELEEWCITAVSGFATGCGDPGTVSLLLLRHGRIQYVTRNEHITAEPNSAHLFVGDRPVRFTIPVESRALRVTVPLHFFAADVRAALGAVDPARDSTRVVEGLVAIAEQVLGPVRGGSGSAAARAMRPLAIAAVEEATPHAVGAGLREQMEQYIEAHISDPELAPATIAAAFGISLRSAHQVFSSGGQSLARHIRDRRLDIVAAQLRRDRRFPRVSALAERSGFSSRDSLTRACREKYGQTIADYAAAAVEARVGADRDVERGERDSTARSHDRNSDAIT